jgi:hypothetical protein
MTSFAPRARHRRAVPYRVARAAVAPIPSSAGGMKLAGDAHLALLQHTRNWLAPGDRRRISVAWRRKWLVVKNAAEYVERSM